MDTIRRAVRWMFTCPADPASLATVFTWWEVRRLPFNLIVGTYGVFCLTLFFVVLSASGALQPGDDAVEPLVLLLAPIAINGLYTTGWIVEWTCRIFVAALSPQFGPRLLVLGIGLGLILSTMPVMFALFLGLDSLWSRFLPGR